MLHDTRYDEEEPFEVAGVHMIMGWEGIYKFSIFPSDHSTRVP